MSVEVLTYDESIDTDSRVEIADTPSFTCEEKLGYAALCASCPLVSLFGDCPKVIREEAQEVLTEVEPERSYHDLLFDDAVEIVMARPVKTEEVVAPPIVIPGLHATKKMSFVPEPTPRATTKETPVVKVVEQVKEEPTVVVIPETPATEELRAIEPVAVVTVLEPPVAVVTVLEPPVAVEEVSDKHVEQIIQTEESIVIDRQDTPISIEHPAIEESIFIEEVVKKEVPQNTVDSEFIDFQSVEMPVETTIETIEIKEEINELFEQVADDDSIETTEEETSELSPPRRVETLLARKCFSYMKIDEPENNEQEQDMSLYLPDSPERISSHIPLFSWMKVRRVFSLKLLFGYIALKG